MKIRRASIDDTAAVETLYRAFFGEWEPRDHDVADLDAELAEVRDIVAAGDALVAELDGEAAGFVLVRRRGVHRVELTDLFVLPARRESGVATALVREAITSLEAGVRFVTLETGAGNGVARSVYRRWGFRDDLVTMVADVDGLRERLTPSWRGLSFGSVHVQTDDRGWVERTAAQFAPRIGSPGSRVEGPRNGWTAVYDPVADTDPSVLRRLARELSERMGAVVIALALEQEQVVRMIALERGGVVDEYLSIPEFYGPLPPGDVIGLAANPTVLARITGADPTRVRSVARTVSGGADDPDARSLLADFAGVLGLEGATYGFAGG